MYSNNIIKRCECLEELKKGSLSNKCNRCELKIAQVKTDDANALQSNTIANSTKVNFNNLELNVIQLHKLQKCLNRLFAYIKVLNHCNDDIERFVSRLKDSIQMVRDQSQIQIDKKALKRIADELPQSHAFFDIFQKLKLAFNILSRLRFSNLITNDSLHNLFKQLAIIVNAMNSELAWLFDTIESSANVATTSGSSDLKDIVKNVWLPMLTRDAKEWMLNTLNNKEQTIWV